jgi:hypothetical protein
MESRYCLGCLMKTAPGMEQSLCEAMKSDYTVGSECRLGEV